MERDRKGNVIFFLFLFFFLIFKIEIYFTYRKTCSDCRTIL